MQAAQCLETLHVMSSPSSTSALHIVYRQAYPCMFACGECGTPLTRVCVRLFRAEYVYCHSAAHAPLSPVLLRILPLLFFTGSL